MLFSIIYFYDNKTEDIVKKDKIISDTELSSKGTTNLSLAHIKTGHEFTLRWINIFLIDLNFFPSTFPLARIVAP